MYSVGDFIIYGNIGVCEVMEISKSAQPEVDKDQEYYVLRSLFQNCIITTPVNTTKVFMRPVISKVEAEDLIATIPSIQVEAYNNQDLRQLTEYYNSTLKECDCTDLLELSMSIYKKRQNAMDQKRKFGAIDERFMKRTEELLYGELSVALGIMKNDVVEYIAAKVNGANVNA